MIGISTVLAVCGGIITIGGALTYMVKGYKASKQPLDDLRDRLLKTETQVQQHEEKINELLEDSKQSLESIALLLKHAETGNATGECSKGREALEQYLIQR